MENKLNENNQNNEEYNDLILLYDNLLCLF